MADDKFITSDPNDMTFFDRQGNPVRGSIFLNEPAPPEQGPDLSKTEPSFGEAVSDVWARSPTHRLGEAITRGQNPDADSLDQYAARAGDTFESLHTSPFALNPPTARPAAQILDAPTANEMFAPKGEDWFDKPISLNLAREVARERRNNDQINSNNARFSEQHSWYSPYSLGVSMAGSALDPINVAAAFVPGFGEEAIAAKLGGGVLARITGRAVAGAEGAAAASVPQVGFSLAEDPDYHLYDAFRDLSINAVFGAVLQSGAAREAGILKPDDLMKRFAMPASQAKTAIDTAVSQVLGEKPVDVTPVVYPPARDIDVRNMRTYLLSKGIAKDVPEDVLMRAASIYHLGEDADFALREALKTSLASSMSDVAGRAKHLEELSYAAGMSADEIEQARAGITSARVEPTVTPVLPENNIQPQELTLDTILAAPEVQKALKEPQIDSTHDVPYIAGASKDGTITHVDSHVPPTATISNITFDPRIPYNIHEQVEKYAMEWLIKNRGMSEANAYVTAHHVFAEAAEKKWIQEHAINWSEWQAWNDKMMPGIQHEAPVNPPPGLYTKPYPHDRVSLAKHEPATEVPKVTEAERLIVSGETPNRIGEIEGDRIIGFRTMLRGKIRLKDGTEMPARNSGGAILGADGSIIDPHVITHFDNGNGKWFPVKLEAERATLEPQEESKIHPEAQAGYEDARARSNAYAQAAQCLVDMGV